MALCNPRIAGTCAAMCVCVGVWMPYLNSSTACPCHQHTGNVKGSVAIHFDHVPERGSALSSTVIHRPTSKGGLLDTISSMAWVCTCAFLWPSLNSKCTSSQTPVQWLTLLAIGLLHRICFPPPRLHMDVIFNCQFILILDTPRCRSASQKFMAFERNIRFDPSGGSCTWLLFFGSTKPFKDGDAVCRGAKVYLVGVLCFQGLVEYLYTHACF